MQCHGLCRLGPGRWSRQEGRRGPKSWVKQGYFICINACLYIFNKMMTQPLKRMKFHQLQQNGLSFKYKVPEESHWRESKQVPFPMISVLRTACSSAHSCFPGPNKEQRVLEKWHTKEENILGPLKSNVPWQPLTWNWRWWRKQTILPLQMAPASWWTNISRVGVKMQNQLSHDLS